MRYVILRHENIAEPHFDLMFETSPGGTLATWRSAVWPIEQPTPVLRLADHRRDYLTYEGPVSDNRGSVRRIESGEFVYRDRLDEKLELELVSASLARNIELRLDIKRGEPYWLAQ